jgi:hypothetical protein
MALTDEQKTQVAAWIAEGLKPSDVQSRLESEFGLRVTYMEVRFLMDDLKLMPKDPVPPPEPPKPEELVAVESATGVTPPTDVMPLADPGAPAGGVKVQVDKITRPGSVVSGHVTFSDGQIGEWYLDQMGRLGMVPPTPGYRPPEKDVAEFQIILEQELVKLGL